MNAAKLKNLFDQNGVTSTIGTDRSRFQGGEYLEVGTTSFHLCGYYVYVYPHGQQADEVSEDDHTQLLKHAKAASPPQQPGTHALKLADEPIYEAHAVFAGYDGNAPDTFDLVVCATQELADEVVKILNVFLFVEEEEEFNLEHEGVKYALGLPFVDGWESSKRYAHRKTWAPALNIVTTVTQALEALSD